jgi:AraC family transcriptional regulator
MAGSRSSSASVELPKAETAFAPASFDRALWVRYEARMRRVVEHVHAHLDEPLDMFTLADIACMSPAHWHRIYHAMYGETLAQTVRRLRLHTAAGLLAQSDLPIAAVARRTGYASVQSFTRTFSAVYRMPPARYRDAGQHRLFEMHAGDAPATEPYPVDIRSVPATGLIALEHKGPYLAIGATFDLLFARLATAGRARPGMRLFALFHDDPDLVPAEALRAHAAVAGAGDGIQPAGTEARAIEAGSYAVLTHTGPYATMRAAYRWLYGRWLPESMNEPAAGPLIEEYLNSPRETAPQQLRTRIHLPLAAP